MFQREATILHNNWHSDCKAQFAAYLDEIILNDRLYLYISINILDEVRDEEYKQCDMKH